VKTLNRILATLGLCGLMLLPVSALGDARILDDQRFVTAEETIGKTQEQVTKEIGPPMTTGKCSMNTSVEGQPVTFIGKGWFYKASFGNGGASLSICFIKGYSVSEQRFFAHMGEDGREATMLESVFDHRVLKNVIEGQPDRPRWVDPDGPKI